MNPEMGWWGLSGGVPGADPTMPDEMEYEASNAVGYVDRKSPLSNLATKILFEDTDAVALCFLLTCSSSADVIAC